jgi:type IV pilus assembly protein PilY1
MSSPKQLRAIVFGTLLAVAAVAPSMADDTEIYGTTAVQVRPNILLIVDTSMSMSLYNITNERNTYSTSTTYATSGNCTAGRIFFRSGNEPLPDCATSTKYILATQNHCQRAATGVSSVAGRWTGKIAQWNTTGLAWQDLQNSGVAQPVECFSDNGIHGHNSTNTATRPYARNGDASNMWTNTSSSTINWVQRPTYTLYSANWLNWRRVTPETTSLTRMRVMQNAIIDMLATIDDANIGMMRFNQRDRDNGGTVEDDNYTGGLVTNAIKDISTGTHRATLTTSVDGFSGNTATMLSETVYEASRYWAGASPLFGRVEGTSASDPAALPSTGNYISPITHECQKNFNIILTDGGPTWDNEADPGQSGVVAYRAGACTLGNNDGTNPAGPGDVGIGGDANDGRCLDDIALYLNQNADLSSTLAGRQSAQTYTVAFGPSLASDSFLTDVAADGGGRRFNAADSDQLAEAFTTITSEILETGATFTSASVSVNAFNRTTSRSDVYFSLFNANESVRWEGNVKKYRVIIDPASKKANFAGQGSTDNAIDPVTGFFKNGVRSYWSTADDGPDVTAGGAASRLPDPAPRKIFTFLNASPAGTSTTMPELDTVAVATLHTEFGTTTASIPSTQDVLDFAYSKDEKRMGDPLHSSPVLVTYGGTEASPIDTLYVSTNDGFLHAIDPATGIERWAFVPKELLLRLKTLVANANVSNRTYGLDGELRVTTLDFDQDGIVETSDGDKVLLYFGMRRGGSHYYGLDVTDMTNPRILFKIGPTELPGVGESWSPPTIARVNINGATQNLQKLVLIFGGGYDAGQELYTKRADTSGHRIFMVDAKTGALLWWAGQNTGAIGDAAAQAKRLIVPGMGNSIPAAVSVIDHDADLFADRMYAADTGGRIFRFDITNGNPVSTLVAGGVFAVLGSGAADGTMPNAGTADDANTRRFYNSPDVSVIESFGEEPFYNIAIGSGYRGHPLHKATSDRFYAIHDNQPYTKRTQALYNSWTPLTDASFQDITASVLDDSTTALPPDPIGWKLRFGLSGFQNRDGEKVLSDSLTVSNHIMFNTYYPLDAAVTNPCVPRHGNKSYVLTVFGKAIDRNNDGVLDPNVDIPLNGIASTPTDGIYETGDPANPLKEVCFTGVMIMDVCPREKTTARDYWRKNVDL